MKKNLLYLLALVCSLTFFAACSSDDDDSDNKDNGNPPEEEAVITAPDVVGTYWGNLDISMIPDGSDQEIVIGDGIEKFITLSQVSNTEVKIDVYKRQVLYTSMKHRVLWNNLVTKWRNVIHCNSHCKLPVGSLNSSWSGMKKREAVYLKKKRFSLSRRYNN